MSHLNDSDVAQETSMKVAEFYASQLMELKGLLRQTLNHIHFISDIIKSIYLLKSEKEKEKKNFDRHRWSLRIAIHIPDKHRLGPLHPFLS